MRLSIPDFASDKIYSMESQIILLVKWLQQENYISRNEIETDIIRWQKIWDKSGCSLQIKSQAKIDEL